MNAVRAIDQIEEIRADFPILTEKVNGYPLVYLDNGATTQKPLAVINAISSYYLHLNANVHRGVHSLSQKATDLFEASRLCVQDFIGAKHVEEIIFTRGTTEAINLVADAMSRSVLRPGDEIVVSALEHHSNIVPWQMACEKSGAKLRVIPMHNNGTLNLEALDDLIGPNTKLVAVNHISNALGTINPVEKIIAKAHKNGAWVLIDGAQAVSHMPVNVQQLNADFYCFSGHKLFGPTGIGVLYGKIDLLNSLPPYHGGGEMIKTVSFEKTTYNDLPHKFEAGTPDIAGVIGLKAAIEYLRQIGFDAINTQESFLLQYAQQKLQSIPEVIIYGPTENKASLISFGVNGLHPYDVGVLLDKQGIAVRTGHHCAQPIMDRLCIPGTIRASFAFYNNQKDVDLFIAALKKAISMLQ